VDELRAAIGRAATVLDAPLPVLAAVLRGAALALGPDSGVLHIASGVGTPTVRLYGPVDWRAFGPWRDDHAHVVASSLPCAPCNRLDYPESALPMHPCVRDLEVERVLAAVRRVLDAA
jgi:ADP-heptose:LPS heptosyltransferase